MIKINVHSILTAPKYQEEIQARKSLIIFKIRIIDDEDPNDVPGNQCFMPPTALM